ncbi:MAG TPA: transglycosylase domain-containing protein, partial [Miltoncostaeaceae bacterium]|nr:transglycosylase domain-containing protein [Miltoncostaeaceae bacterium]
MSATRRRRLRARRHRRGIRRRNLLLVGAVAGCALLAIGLFSAFAIHTIAGDLKNTKIKEINLGENTRIYDKNGRQLGIVAGITNRTEVKSNRIPQVLKDATVAIEDKRFYQHHGVDYVRVIGAGLRDIGGGSGRQGASTITMQLMKNLYNPDGGSRVADIGVKVQEAYLAFQYEKKNTKDQILTKYLNGVFYGQNAIGVQAASLTYFNRGVRDITLPQAALLAGLPQAPSAYNPFANPRAAKERRNLVLDQMADQGMISREKADRAKQAGLGLKRGTAYTRKREEYFFEYVRQFLIDRYGEKAVQRGGFRVYTTIDPALQRDAREAINGRLYYDDDPPAAAVTIDSRTGYIRAMASNQHFSPDSQFNFATQAERQAGSTFKTFVLTEAIRRGINPQTTTYVSKPLNFTDKRWGPIDVSTYSNTYGGAMSIAQATLRSDNSVYTQMTLDLDPNSVVDLAYEMGIPKNRDLPRYPSIGLGAGEVTPLDMATAYATLSNGGYRVSPVAISRIVKPDGTVERFRPGRKRVLTDGEAYEVTRILQQNISSGTGTAAQIGVDAAGKTGTTDSFVDAWFVGYTPHYSTAVWVGYPNDPGEKRSMTSVHGIAVAGGSFPAQIWGDYMRRLVERTGDRTSFPLPQTPVEWSTFSSSFTRAGDDAARSEEEEAASAASAASASSAGTDTTPTTTAPTK